MDIKKQKSTEIKTGDNSNIVINKNSNNKWIKTKTGKIVTSITAGLTFSGIATSTGYLLHANSELNTKVNYILNASTKWVIVELDNIINNINIYPKEVIKAKLETIRNFLSNIDNKYSSTQQANDKINFIERKLKDNEN